MDYRHRFVDGSAIDWPLGKVVCIGRNYLDHIRELGNAVPEAPLLFIKPATAVVGLDAPLRLPAGLGECHHELELAVLIGARLSGSDVAQARAAVAGYGLALDLTLRDVQAKLKAAGQPWERAKAFDGACPLSPFVPPTALADPEATEIELRINGERRQHGSTAQMMHPVFALIAHMSGVFTLLPGDVVLTGTPAGVGPLASGDALELRLAGRFTFTASVA